jgi:hypothetical protein
METFIFAAGLFVSLLFLAGYWTYRNEISARRQHQNKKQSNNEYRTKEEYISYPE